MATIIEKEFETSELSCRMRTAETTYETEALLLEVRGRTPDGQPPKAFFVTSVLDSEGSAHHPVRASMNTLQEPKTLSFYHQSPPWELNKTIPDWELVGVVPLDYLICPFGGQRTLTVVLRLISPDASVEILNGQVVGDALRVHWSVEHRTTQYLGSEGGYVDWGRDMQAYAQAIRLAVAVAAVDGQIDEAELRTIKQAVSRWGKKMGRNPGIVSEPSPRARLESMLDAAVQSAQEGQLDHKNAVRELKQLDSNALVSPILGLCLDVLAADGVADARERGLIESIATDLGLSSERVAAMLDETIAELQNSQE